MELRSGFWSGSGFVHQPEAAAGKDPTLSTILTKQQACCHRTEWYVNSGVYVCGVNFKRKCDVNGLIHVSRCHTKTKHKNWTETIILEMHKSERHKIVLENLAQVPDNKDVTQRIWLPIKDLPHSRTSLAPPEKLQCQIRKVDLGSEKSPRLPLKLWRCTQYDSQTWEDFTSFNVQRIVWGVILRFTCVVTLRRRRKKKLEPRPRELWENAWLSVFRVG